MTVKKLWVLVLLFACLGMVLSSLEIKSAQATTIETTRTFSSQSYDGHTTYGDIYVDYTTVWSHVTGDVVDTSTSIAMGQHYIPGVESYSVSRSFLYFDTSIIPAAANIISANLSLYIYEDYSDTDFNIMVQIGDPSTYPHTPLEPGDYEFLHYVANGGQLNTSTLIAGYNNITLNAQGIIWINLVGTTRLCLRSSRDVNINTPTGVELITFYSCEKGTAYAPKLHVTYEVYEAGIYHYVVHGPYYENGAVANCISNVTLYSKTYDPYLFILNGTDGVADTETLDVEQAGWYFQWNASATMTRTYYLTTATFDEFWIYVADPNLVYDTYIISFLDLAGVLKSMPYVRVKRYINGVKTVERQKVDVENKVCFYLEKWAAYTIVLEDTTTTYTFGDLTFTDATNIALTLRAVDFPKATLFTYKFVRVYGERALGTPYGTISIIYQDTLNMTNSVKIWINYKNGTNIVYGTAYGNAFIYTWYLARNDTDYQVILGIDHQKYGYYGWRQYFPRSFSTMPWGMEWFGHLPFNTAYIIPALLILFFGVVFTAVNAYVGAFAMVVVAAFEAWMGWLPISSSILVTGFTFAVIMGIIYAKKRIST